MKTKKQAFDLQTAMADSLEWLWVYKAAERAKLEAKGQTGDSWYARHCYTTATELAERVRNAAQEQLDGVEPGTYGLGMGMIVVRISGLGGWTLLEHCRRFLLRSDLDRHNFGRGHVSGERFRAPGLPELAESEAKTVAAKKKEKPVHFKADSAWKPLCTANRKSQRKSWSRPTRSQARVTADSAEVTCPLCLKKLAAR